METKNETIRTNDWLKKKRLSYVPYFLAGFLVFLVNYLCVIGRENLSSFLSVMYLLLVFTQPSEKDIFYILLVTPSTRSMEVFGASVGVWICLLYLLKKVIRRRIIIHYKLFIPMVLYCVYAIQYLFRFGSLMYGVLQPMKIVIVLWFLYAYSDREQKVLTNICSIKKGLFIWIYGVIMALIPTMLLTSDIGRVSAANNDSNILAVQMVFIMACASVIYMARIKTLSFIEYLLIVSICLIICLICGSRNGFLLLGITFGTTIIFNAFSHRMGKSILIVVVVVVLIVLALSTSQVQLYLSTITRRLEYLEQSGNISNGRFELWNEYITIMNTQPILWFIGMGTYSYYGLPQMAHNMVIEDIVSYGIIGTILLFFSYFRVLNKVYNVSFFRTKDALKLRLFGVVPLMIPLIGGITLHTMTNLPNTMMLYIGVSLLALSAEEKRNE